MARIRLNELEKRYEDVVAVKGIDMTVRDEEFLVLVGPSGCGKSTTLRMIAGLEDASAGEIEIGGRVVTDVPPKDRSIAMMFQNYALYPHMTAAENMKFGMRSGTDFSTEEIDRRVEDAGETLDITELLDRKPQALSGGERQRVAIGRAIVREPGVFLLDEPLSNLDAKLRVQMRAELLRLHEELDSSTVYVTHDQTEAMTLGDRVAVLNDGELQQVASPQELYDFPTNRFVAEFIGEPAMNVVPVAVRERDRDVIVEHDGFTLDLHDGDGLAAASESSVSLGVRPEDISLAENLPAGTETFEMEATVREPLGELLLLHCRVGGDEVRVKIEPRSDVHTGDVIEVGFDPTRLHLFDDATGDAVYHSAPRERERTEPTPTG
jgi:multiple sugar transport system ATP-binding protein